ncbi:unnamed protein product, partial [Closterium sp. NIES-64]
LHHDRHHRWYHRFHLHRHHHRRCCRHFYRSHPRLLLYHHAHRCCHCCHRPLHPRHHPHHHHPHRRLLHHHLPAASAATLASLGLAAAALPSRSRSGTDLLSTKEVNSSSKGVGRDKGGGAHPSKRGVRGVPRAAPTATMLDSAASRCFSRSSTV